MNESKPKIDNELISLAASRRELLETLAPLLFNPSTASPGLQKTRRDRRAKRKALRERIAELDGLIVSRVMELTEEPKGMNFAEEMDHENDLLLHRLKKSVELTRKPKENTNDEKRSD